MEKMLNIFNFWDWVRWGVEMLMVWLYATSIVAFVIGLKRHLRHLRSYFSGVFTLSLCPFFCCLFAVMIRIYPLAARPNSFVIDKEMFMNAIEPLYLGEATSFILVVVYSFCCLRHNHSKEFANSDDRAASLSPPVH